jgi:hypothetical protein
MTIKKLTKRKKLIKLKLKGGQPISIIDTKYIFTSSLPKSQPSPKSKKSNLSSVTKSKINPITFRTNFEHEINDNIVSYYTHNNGGRPFRVVINKSKNKIDIFANYIKYNILDESWSDKKILSYNYQKIWIGISPKNEMTTSGGAYGKPYDGNSILLEMTDNSYIFIGDFIFSFKSLAPIIYYNSPVGNNDVPYPYAIDKENNTYLLTDDFVLIKPNPLILKLIKENNYDAYDIYYEFINPSKYSRVNKLIRKIIKETKFEIKSLQYNTIYIDDK